MEYRGRTKDEYSMIIGRKLRTNQKLKEDKKRMTRKKRRLISVGIET